MPASLNRQRRQTVERVVRHTYRPVDELAPLDSLGKTTQHRVRGLVDVRPQQFGPDRCHRASRPRSVTVDQESTAGIADSITAERHLTLRTLHTAV